MQLQEIRIDKWLWAVRIYKTRSQAAEACKSGRILIDDQAVKPSRTVRKGQIIQVSVPPMLRTLEVKELLKNRVGAKLVSEYMTDLTPKEEFEKLEMIRQMKTEWRDRGTGRPTKKERRDIDRLKND